MTADLSSALFALDATRRADPGFPGSGQYIGTQFNGGTLIATLDSAGMSGPNGLQGFAWRRDDGTVLIAFAGPVGAHLLTLSQGSDTATALAFYHHVTGLSDVSAVQTTGVGHGASLAGVVAATFGLSAALFGSGPYEAIAAQATLYEAVVRHIHTLGTTEAQAWAAAAADLPALNAHIATHWPGFGSIAAIAPDRTLTQTLNGTSQALPFSLHTSLAALATGAAPSFAGIDSLGAPEMAVAGGAASTGLATLFNAPLPEALTALERQDMSLFALSLAATALPEPARSALGWIGTALTAALFSDEAAEAAGVIDTEPAARLRKLLALSMAEGWGTGAGDAALRALLSDGADVGSVLGSAEHLSGKALAPVADTLRQEIARSITLFAAELAQTQMTGATLAEGFARATSGNLLTLDYTAALWTSATDTQRPYTAGMMLGRQGVITALGYDSLFRLDAASPATTTALQMLYALTPDALDRLHLVASEPGSGVTVDLSAAHAALAVDYGTVSSRARQADILAATAFADSLLGSGRSEILLAGVGDDTVDAGAGADLIIGGAGNDSINGGTGRDLVVLDGLRSAYQITTTPGGSTVVAGPSGESDTLVGVEQIVFADGEVLNLDGYLPPTSTASGLSVAGTTVNDAPVLGDGADSVAANDQGLGGDDLLFGFGGNDSLITGDGNDTLFGGSGNDTLRSLGGRDLIYGGPGNDSVSLGPGGGADTAMGGAGFDALWLDRSDLLTSETVEFTPSGGFGLSDGSVFDGFEWVVLRLGSGADTVRRTLAPEHLVIGAWQLDGGDGTDRAQIDTQAIATPLNLSLDGITFSYGSSLITLGNFERLNATLGAGDDTLLGGELADHLAGGTGNDLISGLGGADTLEGGAGDDTIVALYTGAPLVLSGGDGTDLLRLSSLPGLAPGADVTISGFEQISIAGSAGDDALTLLLPAHQGAVWQAGPGVDRLTLDASLETRALTVSATGTTSGAKQLAAWSEVELLDVTGGVGADLLNGGAGSDTLRGGAGNDTLTWAEGDGADVLVGGEGLDRLIARLGVNGPVALSPGSGSLPGGASLAGVELFTFTTFGGNDTLTLAPGPLGFSHWSAGSGSDLAVLDFGMWQAPVSGGVALGQFGSAAAGATLAAVERVSVTGGSGADSLSGAAEGDSLVGGDGNDWLDGGPGADLLSGGDGDDTLVTDGLDTLVTDGLDTLDDTGGTDLIVSSVSFTLPEGFEHLTLTGAAATGTGNAGDNRITGTDGANTLSGGAGVDTLIGGAGDDTYLFDGLDLLIEQAGGGVDLVISPVSMTLGSAFESIALTGSAASAKGNELDNLLIGTAGANTLTGQGGIDTMIGGAGDDIYVVDGADVLVELEGGGVDSVNANRSWVLGDHFETLTLRGTIGFSATGNSLANRLTGNSGANLLEGSGGADTMIGGAGDDTYITDGGDTLVELAGGGIDSVLSSVDFTLGAEFEHLTLTGATALRATGNASANRLVGNVLGNTLTGNAGADTLLGGAGDDIYIIDGSDTVVELANEGIDLINSNASTTLGANIEHLTLRGSAALNGTGNALDNRITGNSGANVLNGAGGVNTLIGGQGDDVYIHNGADIIIEKPGEGVDLVNAGVSYTLGDALEHLTLRGTRGIDGTGNSLANVLRGNGGANRLSGLDGADTLWGGAGADTLDCGSDLARDVILLSATSESPLGAGRDSILNFLHGSDVFDFSALDPNPALAGDQALLWGGTTAAARSVWLVGSGADLLVCGDLTGDTTAEFVLRVVGVSLLSASDFLL